VPAAVEVTRVFRIDLADDVIVALCDVEMTTAIELNLVRHVQRRRRGLSAITAVFTLPVSRDRRQAARFEIEPPDPLVIEIAEVERAVRADDHAVWIVDLRVRIPRLSVANERGH
jgi:hypothetical protein